MDQDEQNVQASVAVRIHKSAAASERITQVQMGAVGITVVKVHIGAFGNIPEDSCRRRLYRRLAGCRLPRLVTPGRRQSEQEGDCRAASDSRSAPSARHSGDSAGVWSFGLSRRFCI